MAFSNKTNWYALSKRRGRPSQKKFCESISSRSSRLRTAGDFSMAMSPSSSSSNSMSSAKRSYAAWDKRNATLSSMVPTKIMMPRHTRPAGKKSASGMVTNTVAMDHIITVIPIRELMSSSMDSRR